MVKGEVCKASKGEVAKQISKIEQSTLATSAIVKQRERVTESRRAAARHAGKNTCQPYGVLMNCSNTSLLLLPGCLTAKAAAEAAPIDAPLQRTNSR